MSPSARVWVASSVKKSNSPGVDSLVYTLAGLSATLVDTAPALPMPVSAASTMRLPLTWAAAPICSMAPLRASTVVVPDGLSTGPSSRMSPAPVATMDTAPSS